MKKIISTLIAIFGLAAYTSQTEAVPISTTYEFIAGFSNLAVSSYISSSHYGIEGRFKLTYDLDAETAMIDWVDATIDGEIMYLPFINPAPSPGPTFLRTDNLDKLFLLTYLESISVTNLEIDFLFEKNLSTFPGADVYMFLDFGGDSVSLNGYFGMPVYDGPWYSLDAVAIVVPEPATFVILGLGCLLMKKTNNLRA